MKNLSALAGNALVVLGLALALSALSYAHWEAREQGVRFRVALGSRLCQVSWDAAVLLASAGLLASSRSLWEHIVWAVFALVYVLMSARQAPVRRGKAGS